VRNDLAECPIPASGLYTAQSILNIYDSFARFNAASELRGTAYRVQVIGKKSRDGISKRGVSVAICLSVKERTELL
jgi:hypothetical protein